MEPQQPRPTGRRGITQEQVTAAIDALMLRHDTFPTLKQVREHLGTGSMGTISRFVARVRESRPQAQQPPARLSDELAAAISREVELREAGVRNELAQQLGELQQERDDLADESERQEARLAELEDDLRSVGRERDGLAGRAAEQAAEIERLQKENGRERRAAEEARVELAQVSLRLEAQAEAFGAATTELKELRASHEKVEQARQEAAQRAAVLDSELKAAREQTVTALEQGKAAVQRAAAVEERALAAEQALGKAGNEITRLSTRLEAAENSRKEALAREQETAVRLREAQEALAVARQETAELRGHAQALSEPGNERTKKTE